jgi:hypothetical protein
LSKENIEYRNPTKPREEGAGKYDHQGHALDSPLNDSPKFHPTFRS